MEKIRQGYDWLKEYFQRHFLLFAVVRQIGVIIIAGLVMLYNVYLGNMVLLFLTMAVNETKWVYGWKYFVFLCLFFLFLALNSIFAMYSV